MKKGLMEYFPVKLHLRGLFFALILSAYLSLSTHAAKAGPVTQPEVQKSSITIAAKDGTGAFIGNTASEERRGAVTLRASSRAEVKSSDGTGALKVDEQFFVGKVIDVTPLQVNDQLLQATGMMSKQQLVTVEIEEGPLKGLQAKVLNEITDNPASMLRLPQAKR